MTNYNKFKNIKFKYYANNTKQVKERLRFKCTDCGQRFGQYNQLFNHATRYHKDLIGDEDPDKYLFDRRNPGPHLCVICKERSCTWNPKTKKYTRLCDNQECHKKAREEFRKNMKRVYGTDNLLNDPERQAAMLANRSISGTFTFPDGTKINFTGQFEEDFLHHCVEVLNMTSLDIISAPPTCYIQYMDTFVNKERWYIPDFYLPKYDLVVEIKDKSKYPIDSKAKVKMKESAVIKEDKFNYIKIVDKNYDDFDKLLSDINEGKLAEKDSNKNHFFIIPEDPNEL